MATLPDTISSKFLEVLKAIQDLSNVSIIRAGDNSEDRGPYIIVLDVTDEGGYDGIPGGILENARCSVALLAHTTDDPSGTVTDTIKSTLSSALWSLQSTVGSEPIGDWIIRYISPWTEGPISLDGSYRRIQFQASLILQNKDL